MKIDELIKELKYTVLHLPWSEIRKDADEVVDRVAQTLEAQQGRIAQLEAELREEMYRHDRVQDFEVAEAQELAKLRQERRWIPVEEDLPKKITNKVNVLCKNGYRGFGHFEKHNGEQIWYNLESGEPFTNWDLEDCESYEVTHWAHLPEPPEVDG